jgi:hypothetical protein
LNKLKEVVPVSAKKDFVQDVTEELVSDPFRLGHYMLNHTHYDPDGFFYDKFRDVYYRFIKRPMDQTYEQAMDSLRANQNAPHLIHNERSVVIYDSAFNIIGEHETPKNIYPFKSFITEEGLWLEYHPENESEDSLYFRLMKLETVEE